MYILFLIIFIFANYIGLSLIKSKDLTRKIHWKSFFISTIICTVGLLFVSHNNAFLIPQLMLASIYNIGFLIGWLFITSRNSIIIVVINILMLVLSIFPFGLLTACILGDCL